MPKSTETRWAPMCVKSPTDADRDVWQSLEWWCEEKGICLGAFDGKAHIEVDADRDYYSQEPMRYRVHGLFVLTVEWDYDGAPDGGGLAVHKVTMEDAK